MFNKDFYPTPKSLIKKMLSPYLPEDRKTINGRDYFERLDLSGLSILEPSAGKGDILDYIHDVKNNAFINQMKVYAIESNTELQSILKEKNYPLIGMDFLQFEDQMYFDLIIMNPPFSNGAAHLLKAFKIANKTKIICLLNAETIRNPYTRERKLLLSQIEKYDGKIEYLDDEFENAERRTGVQIALITVDVKKEDNRFDFDFDKQKEEKLDFDFDFLENEIARQDLIGNLNLRFEKVKDAYADLIEAEEKYKYLKNQFIEGENYYSSTDWELKNGKPETRYNYLTQKVKSYMWRTVISELDMKKYMSNKVLKNFEAFVNQQSNMAFTKDNVANFFQMIMNNRVNIWDQAVIDVFDMLTTYYEHNRNYIEGWKTNDRYKVNRKIILPNWVEWDISYMDKEWIKSTGAMMKICYSNEGQFSDIDKVMAYISGESLPYWRTINSTLKNHFEKIGKVKTGDKFDNTCESAYFKIKFYKKGTVHLEFKDKRIWELFNITACGNKNWLPADEKRKWENQRNSKNENQEMESKELLLNFDNQ